ncbi:MAG: BamA/TamA family outer membrane protein [Ignavibacteriota bacterium]
MLRTPGSYSILCYFLFAFFLCAGTAEAQRPPDIQKIRKQEVSVIRFEGDSAISPIELESIIATRTSSWFERSLNAISSSFGTPRQFVDPIKLDEDTLRLYVYYRNHGFFDARVRSRISESTTDAAEWQKIYDRNQFVAPNKWESYPLIADTVIFSIYEGKQYTIEGFTFEGFEKLPMELQTNLTKNIGIKAKSTYSKQAIDQEVIRVQDILGESGYPFLSLPYGYTVVERDTARKSLTISIRFRTGPRVLVGQPVVIYDTAYSKTAHVREKVVFDQLSLKSGEWYKNSNKLASERDLHKLGTFQSVKIELDTSGFSSLSDSEIAVKAAAVIIYLRMRQAWELTPYFYGGESSLNQAIFGVGLLYSNRNIFNGAENLQLQASYQIFPAPSVERRWNISGDLILPIFSILNSPFVGSLGFSYAKVTSKYFEQIISGTAGYNFELSNNPNLRITLSPKGALQLVQRDYYDPALRPIDTTFELRPQFNTIVSFDLAFNSTNDILYPSSGWFASWSPQWAVPVLNSASLPSAAYIKNTVQFKYYFDLGSVTGKNVLAYRILTGLVILNDPSNPNKDILFENRYYGGGPSSLRGWAARSLLVSNNKTPGWPSLGGYKIFETNLEWRFAPFQYPVEITTIQQFLSALRIALFVDAGNVWDKDVPIDPRTFAIALGTGIRYNTLFGALRLDVGLKLYDPYPDPFLPGTKGADKSRNNILPIPPDSKGEWLFNRTNSALGDILNFEFALGLPF